MTAEYTLIESVPSAEAFCHLRKIAGLSARPLAAAEIGLPRSCYGVHVLWQGAPVGMGRIVGDGALNFEIVDIAVDPAHQGKGLGRKIMEALMAWLDTHAFKGSYVSLVADVPELYAKFGFESVRPESEGMARVWK
ncbi:GNAT family N-acetyltransferase [Kluyvera sichuanensis]|uniref:GNAT family N-acetyltransferase n=1 Tax=Kluyvera sichuanensis TaxID=2725494 RepID=UPI0039F5723E